MDAWNVNEGRCVGGPFHGKQMAHWSKTKEIERTLFDHKGPCRLVSSEYRLNEFGQWHWHPSKDWNAMDQLFGEVS